MCLLGLGQLELLQKLQLSKRSLLLWIGRSRGQLLSHLSPYLLRLCRCLSNMSGLLAGLRWLLWLRRLSVSLSLLLLLLLLSDSGMTLCNNCLLHGKHGRNTRLHAIHACRVAWLLGNSLLCKIHGLTGHSTKIGNLSKRQSLSVLRRRWWFTHFLLKTYHTLFACGDV